MSQVSGEQAPSGPAPRVSVVVATYNRRALLQRLLVQLGRQTMPADAFEVVVVDDGSKEPVKADLEALGLPCALTVIEQANAGAAAARHQGVLAARGELLVILDDDMQIPDDYLAHHASCHPQGSRRVVLGQIRGDPQIAGMPIFERWHQKLLDDLVDKVRGGRVPATGNMLYTGNVSLRRSDYLAVGGFDASLGHSEDAELGIRLEKSGVEFALSEEAYSLHGSDHTSLDKWLKRAFNYGVFDSRIGRKHQDVPHANPWRFISQFNPVFHPLVAAALLAPRASRPLSRAGMWAATAVDRLGFEKVALAGTTLVYAMEYYRGVREEAGGVAALFAGYHGFLRSRTEWTGARAPELAGPVKQMVEAIHADYDARRFYEDKYRPERDGRGIAADFVQKISFQILVAYRLMRALRALRLGLLAKVASRLIRHLYGSDIHWDAQLDPGVVLVHGMGLAVSHAARVESGCILSHNVTLGFGTEAGTRRTGAPHVERNVHIGPGATLVGPIRIGEGSKIMPGAVVTESVPPGSLVEAPRPHVRARRYDRGAAGANSQDTAGDT